MSMSSTITDINNTHKPNITHTHRISSGSQACAACKYQRRKCAPDCILSPYFPHDKQRQFLNAHKLFGVRNITKIIQDMSPHDKDIAMDTIIFQSDMRAKDPVGGVYRIIKNLERQVKYYNAELEFVCQQIAMCRAHQAATSSYEILHENDDDVGGGEVLNHHPPQHHLQDFQYSWNLQDSVWIPSKETCREGSP